MSKSIMFAVVIAMSGASISFGCDQCNGAHATDQWITGCCDREPRHSDHLWDDYCSEGHGCKFGKCRSSRCGSNCAAGLPGCSRWRPRSTGFGGHARHVSHGGFGGYGFAVEAPLDAHHAGPAQHSHAASPAPHGAGCMCPQCTAASNAVNHGPGCMCPHCQKAAAAPAAESTPQEILELTPTPAVESTEELRFEPAGEETNAAEQLEEKPFQNENTPETLNFESTPDLQAVPELQIEGVIEAEDAGDIEEAPAFEPAPALDETLNVEDAFASEDEMEEEEAFEPAAEEASEIPEADAGEETPALQLKNVLGGALEGALENLEGFAPPADFDVTE